MAARGALKLLAASESRLTKATDVLKDSACHKKKGVENIYREKCI